MQRCKASPEMAGKDVVNSSCNYNEGNDFLLMQFISLQEASLVQHQKLNACAVAEDFRIFATVNAGPQKIQSGKD